MGVSIIDLYLWNTQCILFQIRIKSKYLLYNFLKFPTLSFTTLESDTTSVYQSISFDSILVFRRSIFLKFNYLKLCFPIESFKACKSKLSYMVPWRIRNVEIVRKWRCNKIYVFRYFTLISIRKCLFKEILANSKMGFCGKVV